MNTVALLIARDPMSILEFLGLTLCVLYMGRLAFADLGTMLKRHSLLSRRTARFARREVVELCSCILPLFAVGGLISLPKRALLGQRTT